MPSSTLTSLLSAEVPVTSIVFNNGSKEAGARQKFIDAYCLSPPLEHDGCPYGPCPNPDVTGIGQQISIYITAGTFAFAVVYFPRLVRPMLYSHLAVIYSLMIAALISIVRGELTQNDGVFVLVAVGSPSSIYLWVSALRSLRTHFHLLGQDHHRRNRWEARVLKLLCIVSMIFEFVLICLLFAPSSKIRVSQPSCNTKYGQALIFNLTWAFQYVREGVLGMAWIAWPAYSYLRGYTCDGRSLSEAVAVTPNHCHTLGNRDTNRDLDLIAWTEELLQARYPTLMAPITIKLVVTVLQTSAFALVLRVATDGFIGVLLLLGIWHPYFWRRDSAFTPARSWITRSLLTISMLGSLFPFPIYGINASLFGLPMVVGIWRKDFKRSSENKQLPTSRRKIAIYLQKGLLSLFIMGAVALSGRFPSVLSVPTLYDLVVLFIVYSARFPSIWRLPVRSKLSRHAIHILLPAGAALIVFVASNPMLRIHMRYLALRPVVIGDNFTPVFILEAWTVSVWIATWLGTTTWLHIAESKNTQRIGQILYGIFYRAHIFKFGLLVFSPNALWIQACILSNPTSSISVTFGQIFSSVVSLTTLLSLGAELRRIKKADWVAMIKSEPLPSKTIVDLNQELGPIPLILPPLGAHEDDAFHLPGQVYGRGSNSDIRQSPSDIFARGRQLHNAQRSSTT